MVVSAGVAIVGIVVLNGIRRVGGRGCDGGSSGGCFFLSPNLLCRRDGCCWNVRGRVICRSPLSLELRARGHREEKIQGSCGGALARFFHVYPVVQGICAFAAVHVVACGVGRGSGRGRALFLSSFGLPPREQGGRIGLGRRGRCVHKFSHPLRSRRTRFSLSARHRTRTPPHLWRRGRAPVARLLDPSQLKRIARQKKTTACFWAWGLLFRGSLRSRCRVLAWCVRVRPV
mmetsp:Transcript_33118/g.83502  ORF Transcript_33118/g.83502 Transcript_33118/m.83502 type:complete len:231 (+) Transcript_33118:6503-7195(+)